MGSAAVGWHSVLPADVLDRMIIRKQTEEERLCQLQCKFIKDQEHPEQTKPMASADRGLHHQYGQLHAHFGSGESAVGRRYATRRNRMISMTKTMIMKRV